MNWWEIVVRPGHPPDRLAVCTDMPEKNFLNVMALARRILLRSSNEAA